MTVVGLSARATSLWGPRKRYQACAKKKQHGLSSTILHPLPPALGCLRAPGHGCMRWKLTWPPCCAHLAEVTTTPSAKKRKLFHTRATKAIFRAPHFPAPSDVWPGKPIFSHCRTEFCLANYDPLPLLISKVADSQQKNTSRTALQDAPALGCHLHLIST